MTLQAEMSTTAEIPFDLEGLGLEIHTTHDSSFIARPGTGSYPQERLDAFIADIQASPSCLPRAPSQGLYKPITNPYEIRVLEIKPGIGTERLEAALHYCTVEFDHLALNCLPKWAISSTDYSKPVFFTALSYTWGPNAFDCSIECDGFVKNITTSLDSAIRQFRHPVDSIMMWIDQICINQDDNIEKAQQIPLMSRIYRLATNTVIWLGEASEGSDSALRLLERIVSCLQFALHNPDFPDLERLGLPEPDSKVWEHLCELLTRKWFTRVWVIQEAVLSWHSDTWFACGDFFLPWKTLADACMYLNTCGISSKLGEKFSTIIPIHAPLGEVMLNIEWMKRTSHPDLFTFLAYTRNAECWDPKDRVYGLLGLIGDKAKAAVRVSYASDYTVASLYKDVTVGYIRGDDPNSLMRLPLVLGAVDHESPDLPSWTPDWRVPPSMIGLNTPFAFSGIYHACGPSNRINNKGKPMAKIHGDELTTPGVLIDTVIKVTDTFDNPDLSYQSPMTGNTVLITAVAFVSQMQKNGPYGGCIFEALWNTLVAGRYDKVSSEPWRKETASKSQEPFFAEIFSFLIDETIGTSHSVPGQTYSGRQKRPKGKGGMELSSLGRRTLGQTFQEARVALRRALKGRTMGITSKGYLGLFPRRVAVGDVVYVFDRCPVPYVLRSVGSEGKFKFIGECFVYGIMDGEAVEPEDICLGGVTLV
ncbi:heterokaryon incompatibility protein-domain-containing protein [Fusarium flagelliforme]|uniref:heterokaryon incompatibility protein-domain-containing protein n=1 Tax=Fusarium flagelliforme TaxID=2675880 RepID=UPI001E8DAE8B|nr:heterokaryon incompatibility protein-domain-containing protein [Fusarium flagelliforme]KAH7184642.1 heterokaryon incompatibility protein-domain-containing protein [Fusarium flagelliforme]